VNANAADLLQTFMEPGKLSIISANDLLKLIYHDCGESVARVWQQIVLKRATTKDLNEEQRTALIKFCKPRTDVLSRACLRDLEQH